MVRESLDWSQFQSPTFWPLPIELPKVLEPQKDPPLHLQAIPQVTAIQTNPNLPSQRTTLTLLIRLLATIIPLHPIILPLTTPLHPPSPNPLPPMTNFPPPIAQHSLPSLQPIILRV